MRQALGKKSIIPDRDVFKTIFRDQWEEFKEKHPQYNTEQYNNPVQKMLGCGDVFNGYSEHICMYCGRDKKRFHSVASVVFVCLVPSNTLIIL